MSFPPMAWGTLAATVLAAIALSLVLMTRNEAVDRRGRVLSAETPVERELAAARLATYAEAADQMHADMKGAMTADRPEAFLVLVHAEQEGLARLARLAHDRESDPVMRRRADAVARQAERQADQTKRWLNEYRRANASIRTENQSEP